MPDGEIRVFDWTRPPPMLALTGREVHVWRTSLIRSPESYGRLETVLSADELQRAVRFRFERHRLRFIAARGVLRCILGRYLDLDPAQVRFTYSPQGKPAIAPPLSSPAFTGNLIGNLQFNLSHSEDMAVYAIRGDRPVGIDVEYVRPIDALALAQRFFTTGESSALAALPSTCQEKQFFHVWTRKEAYLKATGEGIAGLHQVEVTVKPEEPARFLHPNPMTSNGNRWVVFDIAPGSGYVAALVSQMPLEQISCWHWD